MTRAFCRSCPDRAERVQPARIDGAGFFAKGEPMTKAEVAAVLEEIAALLELKGENPFKIRAYANAARSIETFGGALSVRTVTT